MISIHFIIQCLSIVIVIVRMSQDSGPQTPADPADTEKTHLFNGTGTAEDPFIVEFQKDDQSNPMNWGRLENGS